MSRSKIYRKGDLVEYVSTTKLIDDNTSELIEYKQYPGIGIIIDDSGEQYGWVRIWWREQPHLDLNTKYLTINIRHYKL